MKFSKWLWTVAVISAGALPAQAQSFGLEHKVGLEFRTDLQLNNSTLNSKEDLNDETKSQKFVVARSRIRFSGKLNETTSYFVRLRFDRSFDNANKLDSTGDGLNNFFLDRKITQDLTFRIGKISKKEGAWEADYSGMDVYQLSFLDSKRLGTSIGQTGVQGAYSVAKQTFIVQVLNSNFPNGSTGQKNQKNFAYNIGWDGNFGDGLVKTIITAGSYPSAKQTTLTKDSAGKDVTTEVEAYNGNQWGAGARLSLGVDKETKVEIEAEADNVTIGDFDTKTTNAGKAPTTKNTPDYTVDELIFLARYNAPSFKPFLKLSSGKEKKDGDDVGTHVYTSAGVEFFPDSKDGLKAYRVHAVYIQKKHECENGFSNLLTFACKDPVKGKNSSDDQSETQINLGVSTRFN